jgi:hypothetical protein
MNCVDTERLHRAAPMSDKEDVFINGGIVFIVFG